jgi:hypothetical protein
MSPLEPGGVTVAGGTGLSSAGKKSIAETWMRWNNDSMTRANQDHQRELEATAVRELVKHLEKRKAVSNPTSNRSAQTEMIQIRTVFRLPLPSFRAKRVMNR